MHDQPFTLRPTTDTTTETYFHNGTAKRINTDLLLVGSLRQQYPTLHLTIVPVSGVLAPCNLLSFAASGHAKAVEITERDGSSDALKWKFYIPPARRLDGGNAVVVDNVVYGKFMYTWKEHEFIMYVANGRDGMEPYPRPENQYILGADEHVVNELVRACCDDALALHGQIWVYDKSIWQKDGELYQSVQKASWDDVILDEGMKKDIQVDVGRFFASRERYERLRVPWKRGVIWYGPPGNGKTVSIKAMIHTLYNLEDPVPALYVKSFFHFFGPQFAISTIFAKARQVAPCFLIFEDLDSLVTDAVRSYFLNEIDGLGSNDGIFMVGSTNHLERLDPGVSKRPSRFDRKYLFPLPSTVQRTQYCNYWRSKLSSNTDVEFPEGLSAAIAGITEGFSFAFLQEAFVASLLAIAAGEGDGGGQGSVGDGGGEGTVVGGCGDGKRGEQVKEEGGSNGKNENSALWLEMQKRGAPCFEVSDSGDDGYKESLLWKEMQKQVKILREQM